jgi:hypothetical protein
LGSCNVIVILRDQKPEIPGVRGMRGVRAAALSSAQDPIVAHLQTSGATRIHRFELINAVAAHVSAAEAFPEQIVPAPGPACRNRHGVISHRTHGSRA